MESPYLVLVEFVYKHLDFHLAELTSILELHGIVLGSEQCRILPLPLPFNYAEIQANRLGKDNTDGSPPTTRNFCILSFPSDSAVPLSGVGNDPKKLQQFNPRISHNHSRDHLSIAEILHKCTLVKTVMELWAVSTVSLEECAKQSHQWISSQNGFQKSTLLPMLQHPGCSWKFSVHTLGTTFTREEHDQMRMQFKPTLDNFPGKVQLRQPDQELLLIREIELDGMGGPLPIHKNSGDATSPTQHCTEALAYYFGRILGGPRLEKKRGMEQYCLKNRPYLGPTSMDATLSFVMTSLGLVKSGSIVYDPFVGTGSILLSCALRGAYCIGSDIDIRVLRGKGGSQQIWSNFEQYGLPRPEILRTDNALYHKHFRHHPPMNHGKEESRRSDVAAPLYDAIITDPPYGIRAGARKTGSKRDHVLPVSEENRHDHIAQTKAYAVSDVMADLLDMAARTLTLGGRLVYIIPSYTDFEPESDLPRHACLEMIHSCYQPFNNELGRRIVAMKKTAEYDENKSAEYQKSIWVHGAASAEKCANLREKILETARQKPGYEEKAAIRKQKRKAHKSLKKLEKRSKQMQSQEDREKVVSN
jgi:tRNA (guanine10-N2)-methyltransferase